MFCSSQSLNSNVRRELNCTTFNEFALLRSFTGIWQWKLEILRIFNQFSSATPICNKSHDKSTYIPLPLAATVFSLLIGAKPNNPVTMFDRSEKLCHCILTGLTVAMHFAH